jgi:NAD-dependent dihydropyrimidine dehydrogenase PreA subunit
MGYTSRRDFLAAVCSLIGTGFVASSWTQEALAKSDTHTNQSKSGTQVVPAKSDTKAPPIKPKRFTIAVDRNRCNGCEECVDVCPVEVFAIIDQIATPINVSDCLCCDSCIEVCSEGAISITGCKH